MDPVPYIVASYGLGFILILGYTVYLAAERRFLSRLAASLKETKSWQKTT